MRNDRTNPDPSPEQLAAFLDGELDAADRARVETWLTTHPNAAAEIDGQRRVARLWADNPPPEPGPAAWATALAGVRARLPVPRPRRLPRTLWLGAGAAAVLLAALIGARLSALVPKLLFGNEGGAARSQTGVWERGSKSEKSNPRPVVTPGDVVVAAPPIQQAILPAGQDDVSIMSMESYPGDDGRVPQIGEGDVPMIVAPLARAGGR